MIPPQNITQVILMSEPENKQSQEESQEERTMDSVQEESGAESSAEVSTGKGQKRREPKPVHDSQFDTFLAFFNAQGDAEAKLQLAIAFMETSLAEGGMPNFRRFWEARRLCLPLFREAIAPPVRSQLWERYSELSKEARRLKDMLDEQSSFAVEQIEIAIKALEGDIEKIDAQISHSGMPDFAVPHSLQNRQAFYRDLQRQLNMLNVRATRIHAMRKELIKTEMRVRNKNQFFQRLSAAGDLIFPRRNQMIKELSDQFSGDVDKFIEANFGESASQEPLHLLREEIKAWQSLAKALTLNTQSFTKTRTRLSECWDKIKEEDKERKKERSQQRAALKQNLEAVLGQIQAMKEEFLQGGVSTSAAYQKIDAILAPLQREEIRYLRDDLQAVRQLIQGKAAAEEASRQEQERERDRQRRERVTALKDQAAALVKEHQPYSAEQMEQERDKLQEQIDAATITKGEKQEIERILRPLRDLITEKKESALLLLSDDDRQSLQQLKGVLNQRRERRREIKDQLDLSRKIAGSSGLDFEQAMNYSNQIQEEKERLEKAEQGIVEIEEMLRALQAKMRKG